MTLFRKLDLMGVAIPKRESKGVQMMIYFNERLLNIFLLAKYSHLKILKSTLYTILSLILTLRLILFLSIKYRSREWPVVNLQFQRL